MKKQLPPFEPLRIRSLVVPLDGSAFAEQALPWAIAIAEKSGARLRLALVHQPPYPPPADEATARLYTRLELMLRKSQRDYLRRRAADIKSDHGVQVVTAMLEGAPTAAIGQYLGDIGADLLVMTTHGRGGLQRAWLGSVADRLVRTLDLPVLLIRPREEGAVGPIRSFEQILVPLDGSRRAEAVLPSALAMASVFGSKLTLVQAVFPVPVVTEPMTSFPTETDEELTAIQRRNAQDYLEGLAESLSASGVPTSGVAVLGKTPFDAIQAAARASDTGMVALATHGRGGIRRLVLGSVADKLVRAGDLPVLITRPRGK